MIDTNIKPLIENSKLLEKDFTDGSDILSARSVTSIGDEYYIANTMRKAMNGEQVTIGFIGGSITAVAGATSQANTYASLIKDWWVAKFPTATIIYKNAGIGATGSNIGVYRVNENLMTAEPDFVVVEYAVNDGNSSAVLPYYEQLVRTIAYSPKRPGVMLLFNTTSSGTNAQPQHSQIGTYYNLPMVSYRDAMWPELQNGRFTWADLYADTIHPNNKGHILLSKFVTDRLEKIYANINSYPLTPTDNAIKPIEFAPERYKDGVVLDSLDITATMNGWIADHIANYSPDWNSKFGPGWQTSTPNSTISFTVTGKSIAVVYRVTSAADAGKVYASVDGGTAVEINGYTASSAYPIMSQLATNLADTTHTVTFTMGATAGKSFAINGILVSK
jgi:lysophospholipase L1-like esterase